ncbi:hypothetical protein K3495_g15743, partial [Podosphaera aphanis]
MLTAKCFGAANGKVKKGEDGWEKMATDALHILSNSVGFDFKNTVVEYQEKNDPKGLWDILQAINPLSDPTVVSELRREFLTMKFEPSTESVQEVLTKLLNIKVKLQHTLTPFNDDNVKEALLLALPKDNSLWNQARIQAVRENKNLFETVTTLKSYEANIKSSEQPLLEAANAVPRGGSTRSRSRNHFRGRGRGRIQKRGNFLRKEDTGSRNLDKKQDRCLNCGKLGHWKRECRLLKRESSRNSRRNVSEANAVRIENTYLSDSYTEPNMNKMKRYKTWFRSLVIYKRLGRQNLLKTQTARSTFLARHRLENLNRKRLAVQILLCISVVGWILLLWNLIQKFCGQLFSEAKSCPVLTTYAYFSKRAEI